MRGLDTTYLTNHQISRYSRYDLLRQKHRQCYSSSLRRNQRVEFEFVQFLCLSLSYSYKEPNTSESFVHHGLCPRRRYHQLWHGFSGNPDISSTRPDSNGAAPQIEGPEAAVAESTAHVLEPVIDTTNEIPFYWLSEGSKGFALVCFVVAGSVLG